ncbi:GNAT family N-acetyltransferase [Rhizomonospora bruguierae]|uniref:GNAT family N-acetyltransferase n=1 Tax=Rhizomonospora bruguierae TaxID=1581705 RepID=UPI001BCF25B7|nr:GNAT family N-acetyltransferase [Micromonospora sp. NBRC 107566]
MIVIRPERPEDADAVAELHVRAWQRAYADLMPAPMLAGLDPAAWAAQRRARLADPTRDFHSDVAEDAGVVVGMTTVGPYRINQNRRDLDRRYGELLAIYVDPRHWRAGVGGALMAAVLQRLRAGGWGEARLWVLAGNAPARRFYERHGWAPDGTTAMFPLGAEPGAKALLEVRYAIGLG